MTRSLQARVIRVLRESPLPVSTPDLTLLAAFGRPHARDQVYKCLRNLRRAGVVRAADARRPKTGNRRGVCAACRCERWIRTRRLCRGCSRKPDVLAAYPPLSRGGPVVVYWTLAAA